jgi:hypothetical protein
MKSSTELPAERTLLEELRSDCKHWRRLASKCAQTDALVPPDLEDQYRVVHCRILANCQNLAGEELLPACHRHVALQLDELLRPWSSAKSLRDAPPHIVSDLVKTQTILDERLRGKSRNLVFGPLGKLILIACLAAAGGVSIFLFLQWTSSNPTLFRTLQGFLTNLATSLDQTTFTEQFAVALLFSWFFGTWLLSRLSKG